jgi:cell division septum initiation protein DivIVA
LKHTLNWILGKINQVNYLADDLARQVPAGISKNLNEGNQGRGAPTQDGPNIMKRRFDVDSEDASSIGSEAIQSGSDARIYTRRRSVTIPSVGDEFLPRRPLPEPHLDTRETRDTRDIPSLTSTPPKRSAMNPPPPPTRQLPSPPDRSFPSPISVNFPSPSALGAYGSSPQAAHRLPPPVTHQPTVSNYLPPIGTSHSPDSVLRDHCATLQHDVSVQKLAFSSLQGEHDKLLAAFQRSQTRASALEKKHAVSDSEIISLTEEKLRLQQQVIDLEQDVEELSRSRDEFRQAAVQEGSQYVKIVERATKLEEIAGEEKRIWNKLRDDMEKRIELLSAGRGTENTGPATSVDITSVAEGTEMNTPASSVDLPTETKNENTIEPHPLAPTSYPLIASEESVEDLKEEIRRLRKRYAEVENTLQSIRDMGKALVDRVESVLTN